MKTLIAIAVVLAIVMTVSWADADKVELPTCPVCDKPIKPGEYTCGMMASDGQIELVHFEHAFLHWKKESIPERLRLKYGRK